MKHSHEWTEKQARSAQVPNFGKKYVVEPALFDLLGEVKGKKILEYGSGNGYWLDLLYKQGAVCTGIELSEQQISLAKERPGSDAIRYLNADITEPGTQTLEEASFDIVFLEHVLLEIPSADKIRESFRNAFRHLKSGGHLVISDLHPFAPSSGPKNIRVGKDFKYFSSGHVFEIVSRRLDGQETTYRDYHWTLQDITMSVIEAGFLITSIVEPIPTAELAKQHEELAYRLTMPMLIMLKAVKP